MIKKVILENSVETCQFLCFYNELSLACNLIEKIEAFEYSILRIPENNYYFQSVKPTHNLIQSVIHQSMSKNAMIYCLYNTLALRLVLVFKCLALKHTMKKPYLPVRCIYALLPAKKLMQMKGFYVMVRVRDRTIHHLYKKVDATRMKTRQLRNVYKSLKNEAVDDWKDNHKFINLIQQRKYSELVTELLDLNVDLNARIDKQGSDIKYYAYFILSIYSSFSSISYYEAETFVNEVKNSFKVKNSKSTDKFNGIMSVINHAQYLKFYHEGADPEIKVENDIDQTMVYI
jgi:hypothetical protein